MHTDITSPDCDTTYAGKYQLQKNEIVFARTGASVGKTYIYNPSDGCVYYAGFLIRARISPPYSAEFVFQNTLTKEYDKFVQVTSQRSGQPGINAQEYSSYKIIMPEQQEQHAIGSFFSQLDHLITLHQRKYDKLQNIKKSMLEKMFPKNNSKFPEIRFKGFTDAWEQRELGEIVQVTMGQSPDGNTYSNEPNGYILIQGNADLQNGWVVPRVWTTQITKIAASGDLIMSVRAPAGAMGKTAYRAVIGRGVAAIKGNEFIYQLLVKMDSDGFWKTYSCGSTFESLNSDNVKKAEISVPKSEEQHAIGSFFSQLDHLITLHQRKLEKLQNIKKAMLEKMFV